MRKNHPIRWTVKCSTWGKEILHPFYTRSTRKEAIQALLDNLHNRYTWRQLRAKGWRAVKVQIVEVKK